MSLSTAVSGNCHCYYCKKIKISFQSDQSLLWASLDVLHLQLLFAVGTGEQNMVIHKFANFQSQNTSIFLAAASQLNRILSATQSMKGVMKKGLSQQHQLRAPSAKTLQIQTAARIPSRKRVPVFFISLRNVHLHSHRNNCFWTHWV